MQASPLQGRPNLREAARVLVSVICAAGRTKGEAMRCESGPNADQTEAGDCAERNLALDAPLCTRMHPFAPSRSDMQNEPTATRIVRKSRPGQCMGGAASTTRATANALRKTNPRREVRRVQNEPTERACP